MQFVVELLEKRYVIDTTDHQRAKFEAARRYRVETGVQRPLTFLVALAHSVKVNGGRFPRVASLGKVE